LIFINGAPIAFILFQFADSFNRKNAKLCSLYLLLSPTTHFSCRVIYGEKAPTHWTVVLMCLNPVTVVWLNGGRKTTNKKKTCPVKMTLHESQYIFTHESHFPAPHPSYGMFLEFLVSNSTRFYLHIPI